MASDLIRTREDMELSGGWYKAVEKSRTKARSLIRKLVAVDQTTSVVVGNLLNVEIDRLWRLKYPYVKLTLSNPVRFRMSGAMDFKMGEEEMLFINKPGMIMGKEELSNKFPQIYREVQAKLIKNQRW
ncbi:MAG: hypothetical protein ACE5J7_04910 [Candidatus Aenigmatarchaeota archaeon]